jgi:membrane protease YdiL (CAAX protease family)
MNPSVAAPRPVILGERERPFWGFAEIFLIAALFLPAVFAGTLVVRVFTGFLHSNARLGLPLLVAQFIGYGIVFLVLRVMFARHGHELLPSLGWVRQPFRPLSLIAVGLGLAIVVVLLGNLLHLPNTETPFDKLLNDTVSRIAIASFGVTIGPVVEELLFRGFLQPVLIESIGVFPGLLLTAVLFGAMHLAQNAGIWQSGLLITIVGFVLGVVRHVSGSTRASTITHISYNALPFLVVLFSGNSANL